MVKVCLTMPARKSSRFGNVRRHNSISGSKCYTCRAELMPAFSQTAVLLNILPRFVLRLHFLESFARFMTQKDSEISWIH